MGRTKTWTLILLKTEKKHGYSDDQRESGMAKKIFDFFLESLR